MMIANAPIVLCGEALAKRLPLRDRPPVRGGDLRGAGHLHSLAGAISVRLRAYRTARACPLDAAAAVTYKSNALEALLRGEIDGDGGRFTEHGKGGGSHLEKLDIRRCGAAVSASGDTPKTCA